jgi:hypothetical protein
MPGSDFVDVALWGLYLAITSSHVGVEVDGLAYPLHRPTARSYQPRGQGLPVRHHPVLSL